MPPQPRRRLVVLGASNLTRGFLALLDVARGAAGGPVDVVAALGRGRSFGIRSNLLGRGLPGIDGCGLWPALAAAPPLPATALVMDVGNDILYGVEVPAILGWVETALARLAPFAERRVVAGLPMHAVRSLEPMRFELVRRVLVPGCRLTLQQAQERAERVQDGLQDIAARHGAVFRPMLDTWYGFDPIHVRSRHRRAAFAHLLGVPDAAPRADVPRLDRLPRRLAFLFARPARCSWFGREVTTPQPVCTFADGTRVALH